MTPIEKLRRYKLVVGLFVPPIAVALGVLAASGNIVLLSTIVTVSTLRAIAYRTYRFLSKRAGSEAKDIWDTLPANSFMLSQPFVRTSKFSKRVGRIIDELLKDEEGQRLVEHAASKNVVIVEKGETDSTQEQVSDLFGSYNCARRLITIYPSHNKGNELVDTVIHELSHVAQPTSPIGGFSYKKERCFTLLYEGDAFSMPLYLAQKLKQSGHPDLWFRMASLEAKNGFTAAEKFEMAMKSSSSLDEARQKYIQDWYFNIHKFNYLENKMGFTSQFDFEKFPRNFGAIPVWIASTLGTISFLYLVTMPAKLFNMAAQISVERHIDLMENFWGRSYLHGQQFDICKLADNEFSANQTQERILKETIIKNPEALKKYAEGLFGPLSFMTDDVADFPHAQQQTIANGFRSTLDEAVRSTLNELASPIQNMPETIEDLWGAIDTMPSPTGVLMKHMFFSRHAI
jgi:hypothetical protein